MADHDSGALNKPTAKPRRNHTAYENVQIDSHNKSMTQNDDNILINYLHERPSKVLNTEAHTLNVVVDHNPNGDNCRPSDEAAVTSFNDLNLNSLMDEKIHFNKQFSDNTHLRVLPVAAPRNFIVSNEYDADLQSTGAIKKNMFCTQMNACTEKLSVPFLPVSGVAVDRIFEPVEPVETVDQVPLEHVWRRHDKSYATSSNNNFKYVKDTPGTLLKSLDGVFGERMTENEEPQQTYRCRQSHVSQKRIIPSPTSSTVMTEFLDDASTANNSHSNHPNRHTHYEETEIRFKPRPIDCSSTRATFDSADCRATIDSEMCINYTAPGVDNRNVPMKPNDSWIEEDDSAGADLSSSPEPIYSNDVCNRDMDVLNTPTVCEEPLYGIVYGPNVVAGSMSTLMKSSNSDQSLTTPMLVCHNDIIREFDPLIASTIVDPICSAQTSHELLLLESILSVDTYDAKSIRMESGSTSDVSDSEKMQVTNAVEFVPIPPANSNEILIDCTSATSMKSSTIREKLSGVFNLRRKHSNSRKPSEISTESADKLTKSALPSSVWEMCPRPSIGRGLVQHEGSVIRLTSKVNDFASVRLCEQRFRTFADKDMKTPKESIPVKHIAAVQSVDQHNFADKTHELYCFEITVLEPSRKPNTVAIRKLPLSTNEFKYTRFTQLYGVVRESDRNIWMQRLLEAMTDALPAAATSRYFRAGWCYMRPSVSAQWSGAWCMLQKHKKRLLWYSMAGMNVEVLDLRKARCFQLIDMENNETRSLLVEHGPILIVDCPPSVIYMVMGTAKETKIWKHLLMVVAHNNGPSLKQQQLTKGDVAVLVDKCINFVYVYGCMSEGIYRKSGSEQAIQKLLQQFRVNAFDVQITHNDYSEHDVANVLKRFMRDLPERLLGRIASSLTSISKMPSGPVKIASYKELLERLPNVESQTLRKLIGHLNFITCLSTRNKMTNENLAIVWAPTLLDETHRRQSDTGFDQCKANVIIDLIENFKHIYQLTPDEAAKEQNMLKVLHKYHAASENLIDVSKKQSGDLKVWIEWDGRHLFDAVVNTNENVQMNITLTPEKTVLEICEEMAVRFGRTASDLTLYEHILDGELKRPLHHRERPFDVVLRWSYWPDLYRKSNTLRLQPRDSMYDVRSRPMLAPNMDVFFADCRTCTPRSFVLEILAERLVVRKEKGNSAVPLRDIDLTQMTAYIGAERKRCIDLRWAITLLDSGTCEIRTRETPFFGHVIGGSNVDDQLTWFSSLMYSSHAEKILP